MRSPLPHRPRRALALCAIALTAAAAGCGGGDDTSAPATTSASQAGTTGPAKVAPQGDAAQIRAVIDESFSTRNPAACDRIATQRFLEQLTFKRGDAAHRECVRSTAHAAPATSVAISEIEVDGDRATARAVPADGDSAGQDMRLALVHRDGWRLDRMTALQIDRGPYDRAMRRALVREPDAMTAEQADCVVKHLGDVGDERLAQALVAGRRSVIVRATISCARTVFEQTIREELLNGQRHVSSAQADCVVSGLRRRLSDRQLEDVLEASDPQSPPPKILTDALTALLEECTTTATIT